MTSPGVWNGPVLGIPFKETTRVCLWRSFIPCLLNQQGHVDWIAESGHALPKRIMSLSSPKADMDHDVWNLAVAMVNTPHALDIYSGWSWAPGTEDTLDLNGSAKALRISSILS